MAWMIKPLWGHISDSYPFYGYRRKSYLIFWYFIQWFMWILFATYINTWESAFIALCLIFTGI